MINFKHFLYLLEAGLFGKLKGYRPSEEEMNQFFSRILAKEKTHSDKLRMPYIHKKIIKVIDENNEEYDQEALKREITQRPNELLQRNQKISHSGGNKVRYYDLGLPALQGLSVDESTNEFVIVNTCAGAGKCVLWCYARKGGYVQWTNVFLSQTRKLNFLVNDPEGFKNKLMSELSARQAYNSKRGIKTAIRWHDSGDFFSEDYVSLAYSVAQHFPEIDFYAYTKIASVATGHKPDNFIINFSSGAKESEESQVDFKKVKHSMVIPRDMFGDLSYRDKLGKLQFSPKNIKILKDRIAKKYKVNANNILTYQELMRIPYNPKSSKKYNVIVKPGDGDDSANRRDVIGTYLLEH